MNAPRPPMPSPAEVMHYLTGDPQIVFRIANQLGADVFDVEAVLRELVKQGRAVRHPDGVGIPVMWSAVQ